MIWLAALWLSAHADGCRAPALCSEYVVVSREGEPLTLDATRFVGADYLIAGTGPGVVSHFGHAMLRLNFCGPRATPGACAPEDLYAIDVGFAAQVDTHVLSVVGGVVGRYPSRLNATPDVTLRTSYNEEELRDLRAYPLTLTPDQRARLLAELTKQFWTGDQRYSFFNNNCAGSLLDLLNAVLPPDHPLHQTFAFLLAPRGLLEALRAYGLADRVGRVWKSRRRALEARMGEMRKQGINLPGTVELYARVAPATRRGWIERVTTLPDLMVLTRLEAFAWRLARTELTEALVARAEDRPGRCPVSGAIMRRAYDALNVDALKRVRGVPLGSEIAGEADVRARLKALGERIAALATCFPADTDLKLKHALEVLARQNLIRARARADAL